MVTPINVSYSGAAPMRGGRSAPVVGWSGDWIDAGDSLTDPSYGIEAVRWGYARSMFPPRVVWNAGFQGKGVAYVADQLPVLHAAYPAVRNFMVRIGTNQDTVPNDQADFDRMIAYAAANNLRICFLQIPPKQAQAAGVTSPKVAMNAFVKSRVDANPSFLAYIADSNGLASDAYYNADYSLTSGDGVHTNFDGMYIQGEAERAPLRALLPNVSPLISDGTDIYPANGASNQYVQNPLMLGGSGSTLPTGLTFLSAGPAVTSVQSVVIDPDGTRWARIVVNSVSGAGNAILTIPCQNPAIAADMTIARLDCMVRMRRSNVDIARSAAMRFQPYVSGGNVKASWISAIAPNPVSGTVSDDSVLRITSARNQNDSNAPQTPAAYAANSLELRVYFSFTGAAGAGDVGTFDFTCASMRGSAT